MCCGPCRTVISCSCTRRLSCGCDLCRSLSFQVAVPCRCAKRWRGLLHQGRYPSLINSSPFHSVTTTFHCVTKTKDRLCLTGKYHACPFSFFLSDPTWLQCATCGDVPWQMQRQEDVITCTYGSLCTSSVSQLWCKALLNSRDCFCWRSQVLKSCVSVRLVNALAHMTQ